MYQSTFFKLAQIVNYHGRPININAKLTYVIKKNTVKDFFFTINSFRITCIPYHNIYLKLSSEHRDKLIINLYIHLYNIPIHH